MKNSVQHPIYGTITYEESFWSGKRTITLGGTVMQKVKKNVYSWRNGVRNEEVQVKGNALNGVSIIFRNEQIQLWPKPAWYDWLLSILPLLVLLIWGNSVALNSILPVVGGAIGGGIGGGAHVLGMILMRGKSFGKKLLTALLVFLGAFGVAALIGQFIVFTITVGTV